MFGGNQNTSNTGFGFGSNPPQNQQPNTGAFGSGTGGFGSTNTTSAFGGGGSAFGQRPAGTSLFGSGTTSAFGQPLQNASNTSAFGSSGGFGASNNTTSAFGATSGSTGGGLFGAKPASSGFGSGSFGSGTTGAFGNTGAFGSTTNTTPQSGFGSALTTFGQQSGSVVPVTGSQNPPYQVHSERETGQTYTTNFHAISMIPAYRNASFEELRLADYAQGRRYGTTTGGAFGAASTFGGTSTATPSAFGAFGNTGSNTSTPSAFGQLAQPSTTGAFGSGGFGSGNGGFGGTSGFGQTTSPATGGFGASNTGGFGSGTTGGFASTPSTGFGQSTGTGAFGSAPKPGPFSLAGGFGSNTSNTPASGFGSGTTGATGAFGTPPSNTGAFGSSTTTPAANTWGGFGGGSQSSGFGNNTSNQENKPGGFGGFGTNTSNTTTPSTGGAFGAFGQKPAGSGFGGFGNTTGGFGSNTTPQAGGLGSFGTAATAPASTGTGLGAFGNAATNNSGGFGSGNSFFGNKTTTTPSFSLGGGLGSNTGPTGGFGGGSSTFGAGGFGLGNSNQNNTGSMFGTPQPQQNNNQLHQSILSTPYGSNPLFQMGGSSSYGGDASKPIVPIATLVPKESKDDKNPAILAGFRLTPNSGKSRFSLGGSTSPMSPFRDRKRDVLGLGTPTKLSLNATPSNGSGIELTPEAFVVPKKGLKSLEISRGKRDFNISGGDIKGIEVSDDTDIGTSKSSAVDPRLEKEAREKEKQRIEQETRKKEEDTKKKTSSHSGSNFGTKPKDHDDGIAKPRPTTPSHSVASTDKTLDVEDEGAYWTIPSMSSILAMRDVRAIPNFVVGRKGYGQIRFHQPVDLSHVRSIPDIPGTIVVFDLKICTVYPDESIKPPVGRGLNVPARITLEKCWPVSKETRRPILDVENPRFIAHVERLKSQAETEFIDYIGDTGSWIFDVRHFSSYQCPESMPSHVARQPFDNSSLDRTTTAKAFSRRILRHEHGHTMSDGDLYALNKSSDILDGPTI